MREDSLGSKCRHLFYSLGEEEGWRYCMKCGGSASFDWVKGWLAGQMVGKHLVPDPATGPNVYIVVDDKREAGGDA